MIRAHNIAGNIYGSSQSFGGLETDYLELEWYEADKGILRRFTTGGREIGFRNQTAQSLEDGDVIFSDASICIVIRILPCLCLVIHPENMLEMANVCFEIGNRHLPVSIRSSSEVVIAYEDPLYRLFVKQGYHTIVEDRVLQQTQTLRIHEWTQKTKFKITLASKINESFVDPAADQ
ncbi:urease accessory protein UreE [Sphingobacterium spiritivorum]|uniref:Urease accessory protein UreE n=1 Tax=Sphingobacterium spiritivorum ATCC 33861 TaxID=525373 RepID=D7VNX2_SPHSI|nr:urease accessory protein UreE [Sphingobacterium spiritivorum]EFK57619.1 urease accessory protein UreE domain protein [Sphingobacterium spiritivorum ATCC 33861]QQT36337.1 urease accessory protein UreE [Sphingobacterium spiritivorum]WQD33077.1 urease accessory protein UreE [Sphingobacterium spiritivorum]SUJ18656.1 Urease accessory protein UreE [Sphingobacterium spiritivorum]